MNCMCTLLPKLQFDFITSRLTGQFEIGGVRFINGVGWALLYTGFQASSKYLRVRFNTHRNISPSVDPQRSVEISDGIQAAVDGSQSTFLEADEDMQV